MTERENRSRSKNVAIARDVVAQTAAVIDDTVGEGNLVRVGDAKFLSLVGQPSNATGFKVVRSAEPQPTTEGAPVSKPTIRRTRRSDVQPVHGLTFPEGTTAEVVAETLKTYGMVGYNVSEEKGVFRAVRGDLKSIANDALDIKLNDAGVIAHVQRTDAPAPANPKSGIALAAIEFDPAKFTPEQITEWLTRNSIDSKIAESENSDNALVVRRSAVAETEEVRRMALEDGVTAVIVRSDVNDIPDGYAAVISECAYGNWGWGQLDFLATIADIAFCEQMEDATYRLRSVLQDILFYSSLPLDVRKTLVQGALEQFGAYANAIMDSLPRQLLVSVVRSAQLNLENSMTKATEGGAPTPAAVAAAATPAAATPAPTDTITRADAEAMVAAAVDAALAKRAEKPAETPAAEAAPAAAVAATPAAAETLTRADLAAAFAEGVKPLVERMEKIEGTTILRSAETDPKTEAAPVAGAEHIGADGKVNFNTVFRGAIPGIGGRKATA